MRRHLLLALLLVPAACASAPDLVPAEVTSTLTPAEAGDLVLLQEVWFDAPAAEVWAAFTTDAGWTSWASPVAAIDLRAGGTIRTHYTPGAAVGDPGTNTLHIVNYVPERVLTLRAELAANWPEVMRRDHERLMNVVLFTAHGDRTHLESYGVGYRDDADYRALLDFFVPANEGLLAALKQQLEE